MWRNDVRRLRLAVYQLCFVVLALSGALGVLIGSRPPSTPAGLQGALLPTLSLSTARVPVVAQVESQLESRTYDITAAVSAGVKINALSVSESAETVRSQIDEQVAQCRSQTVEQVQSSKSWTPATLRSEGELRFVDVYASAEAHQHVASLIESMARSGFGQVSIEVRFMASPQEYLTGQLPWTALRGMDPRQQPDDLRSRADGVSGRVTVDESLPVLSAVIGPLLSRALVTEHQNDPDGNILFSTKITMWNGFSGTLISEVQRPFLTSVDLTSGQRSATIKAFPDGTRLRLIPEFSPDHTSIRIAGDLEIAELLTVTTVTGNTAGGPVGVQVPRLRRSTIEFAESLKIGDSLVIQCPPTADRPGYRHLLITPVAIPPTEAK